MTSRLTPVDGMKYSENMFVEGNVGASFSLVCSQGLGLRGEGCQRKEAWWEALSLVACGRGGGGCACAGNTEPTFHERCCKMNGSKDLI